MKKITKDNYKEYLINYGANDDYLEERRNYLLNTFSDDYLDEVIDNTYMFLDRFINRNVDCKKEKINYTICDEPINIKNSKNGLISDVIISVNRKYKYDLISLYILREFLSPYISVSLEIEEKEFYESETHKVMGKLYTTVQLVFKGDFSLLKSNYDNLKRMLNKDVCRIRKKEE